MTNRRSRAPQRAFGPALLHGEGLSSGHEPRAVQRVWNQRGFCSLRGAGEGRDARPPRVHRVLVKSDVLHGDGLRVDAVPLEFLADVGHERAAVRLVQTMQQKRVLVHGVHVRQGAVGAVERIVGNLADRTSSSSSGDEGSGNGFYTLDRSTPCLNRDGCVQLNDDSACNTVCFTPDATVDGWSLPRCMSTGGFVVQPGDYWTGKYTTSADDDIIQQNPRDIAGIICSTLYYNDLDETALPSETFGASVALTVAEDTVVLLVCDPQESAVHVLSLAPAFSGPASLPGSSPFFQYNSTLKGDNAFGRSVAVSDYAVAIGGSNSEVCFGLLTLAGGFIIAKTGDINKAGFTTVATPDAGRVNLAGQMNTTYATYGASTGTPEGRWLLTVGKDAYVSGSPLLNFDASQSFTQLPSTYTETATDAIILAGPAEQSKFTLPANINQMDFQPELGANVYAMAVNIS